MEGTTDSQILECSPSFSLPSEPPDISNWYPSYKYESFVLDTYDGVGASHFSEGETKRCGSGSVGGNEKEKEKVFVDSQINSLIDDEFEAQTCNKMPDSLYSAALISEPPHINNWFSSYEYQSPMLDDEDLKVSATQDSDCDKDKLPINSRQSRKEDNFKELGNSGRRNEGECAEILAKRSLLKDSLGEIPDSSEVSSLSGPPDIGNWFSSYAYKSPELDENSELVIGETEYEEDQFSITKKEKEMESHKLEQCKNAVKGVTDLIVPSDNNSLENECKEKGGLDKQQTPNSPGKTGFVSSKTRVKLSSSRGFESPSKLIYKQNENIKPNPENHSAFTSSKDNPQLVQVAAASTRQGTCEFNNMESKKEESVRDGFVTTKKSRMERSNKENSSNRHSEITLPCSNNRSWLEGDEVKVRRKALSERSNIGGGMEVKGKWKCPQKRKPIMGRPLKQLRLEQWVRKQH